MRLSPPSLGSSVKIQAGTLAFGNDKNLWLRKERNDKNTYWSSFAELDLELGIPRNEEGTYNYLQIEWEIPNFGIFNLTYINSGRITFQSFANNNDELLFLNVPLIRASSNKKRIYAFKDIIFDFIDDLRLIPDIDLQLITTMSQELNKLFNVFLNGFYDISENYLDKNDYDFQASIDFPLKRTFRPNSDDLFVLDITNEEQEPTPTPQSDEFKPIWRVKTEQEFIDEFGDDWRRSLSWNVAGAMNYLFGKPVTNPTFNGENFTPRSFVTSRELGIDSGNDNTWFLRQQMFKKIQNDQPDEFKPIWRVKTEQEFINEFGDDWRRSLSWNVAGAMNYLFGKPVTNPTFNGENFTPRSFVTSRELGIDSGNDNTWFLRQQMFKKIQNDQPDEFKPIWRVKTEQEFINEFGDDWRRSLSWLRGSDNMDYLFGKPVTNPNFDGENLPPTRIDTAEELGIDSGGDNLWILDSYMFTKIENDQPEPIDIDDLEDGKLFCKSKDNLRTFLKTDSETTELLMYTDGWQFIQPTYWSNESFLISSTKKLIDLSIAIDIELNYETGININYSNIKTREVISIEKITNPTDFTSVIDEIREKVGIDNELSQELSYLKKVFNRDIWISQKIKCAFVEQEFTPEIGKLLLKGNLDTYLKISEDVDRLELNSNEFQYIQPWGIYDDKFFQFEDTYNLRTYGIYCKILLNYKTGIDIYFKNEKNNKILSSYNITSESVFLNAIEEIRRFAGFSPFERELDLIALLLSEGIWRNRSIVCDFVSGLPKPKFQVGDRVKRVGFFSILTIKTITAFDDKKQEWDYDLLNEGGVEVSLFESELELVSTEIPTTSDCDVDVSLIDSQYVGQFYQQNKNRIEALNPNISCLFLEALLSLSNYEKCGDGVEIPMPQPKKEEKEDLLSQIRNL